MNRQEIEMRLVKLALPESIGGCCGKYQDGGYMVLINSALPPDRQEEAFIHEMLHIWRGDLNSEEDVQTIEARTHEKSADFVQK